MVPVLSSARRSIQLPALRRPVVDPVRSELRRARLLGSYLEYVSPSKVLSQCWAASAGRARFIAPLLGGSTRVGGSSAAAVGAEEIIVRESGGNVVNLAQFGTEGGSGPRSAPDQLHQDPADFIVLAARGLTQSPSASVYDLFKELEIVPGGTGPARNSQQRSRCCQLRLGPARLRG